MSLPDHGRDIEQDDVKSPGLSTDEGAAATTAEKGASVKSDPVPDPPAMTAGPSSGKGAGDSHTSDSEAEAGTEKKYSKEDTDRLEKILDLAIQAKQRDTDENRTALITNGITYIPPLITLTYSIALSFTGVTNYFGLASGLTMLGLAIPGFKSLLSEYHADAKDLKTLMKIKGAYNHSGNPKILHDSKMIVRIMGSHIDDIDYDEVDSFSSVRIQHGKYSDYLKKQLEKPATEEQAKGLNPANSQNPFQYGANQGLNIGRTAIHVCITDLPNTLRHLKNGFKDVLELMPPQRLYKRWQKATNQKENPTLLELHRQKLERENQLIQASKELGFEIPEELKNRDLENVTDPQYLKALRKMHRVEVNLREVGQQRVVTATGLSLDTGFMTAAFGTSIVQALTGQFLQAALNMGSAILSLVPVRTLAERQHDLALKDKDTAIEAARQSLDLGKQNTRRPKATPGNSVPEEKNSPAPV